MEVDNKITIIEGPPPIFEPVREGWPLGLNDSPTLANVVMTRLRTFNGPAMLERCHRTWRHYGTMYLEYRALDGLIQQLPIIAARHMEVQEGHLLLLWLRTVEEEVAIELGYDDNPNDDPLDGPDLPGSP
ncbi:MAG: hypothetical protein JW726_14780 [Anaerolineales bacterium]|nr:hypothetical protein [Anaerolineales bacterium]